MSSLIWAISSGKYTEAYKAVYDAMEAARSGSQWVIQQWQWNGNQKKSINAVPQGKLIVLDLFSDGSPAFDSYNGYAPQHSVFCAIPNFGGRSGVMGRLQNVTDNYFKHLELYIRAGEEKLEEMRSTVLPKLRADAAASADPMAGQVVSDFESNVDRFEKKVHDLKISKTIAIQTTPRLRPESSPSGGARSSSGKARHSALRQPSAAARRRGSSRRQSLSATP